ERGPAGAAAAVAAGFDVGAAPPEAGAGAPGDGGGGQAASRSEAAVVSEHARPTARGVRNIIGPPRAQRFAEKVVTSGLAPSVNEWRERSVNFTESNSTASSVGFDEVLVVRIRRVARESVLAGHDDERRPDKEDVRDIVLQNCFEIVPATLLFLR